MKSNTHVFELKLHNLQELKNGAFMECNFLEKVGKEFVARYFIPIAFPIGCQADYDDTRNNSDERATKTKISHNTQIFFYRLDQENMLESVNPGWV
jgi:hypothetical protein